MRTFFSMFVWVISPVVGGVIFLVVMVYLKTT